VRLAFVFLMSCAGQGVYHATGAIQLDDNGVRGGEVSTSGGISGIQLSLDAEVQGLARPIPELPGSVRRNTGGGVDLGLRVSLLGVLANDHRLEHWFDFGGSAMVGGGLVHPARLETFAEASVGGWVEIGLYPGPRYPSLVFEVRRVVIDGWDSATVFAIGLAYTKRFADKLDLRD
jgi:hypothetical protein